MIQQKIYVPDCDPDDLAYLARRIDEVSDELRKLVEEHDRLTAKRTLRVVQIGDEF
jgi:hypothetical protein